MKFNLFKKRAFEDGVQKEWNAKGEKFAIEINRMVEFGEKNGWENWKGEEPTDARDHLADEVVRRLRKANLENKVEAFRNRFPPAHAPLVKYLKEKGQLIEQIHFIEKEKVVFLTGTAYQKRQAYLLNGEKATALDEQIDAVGKSKQGSVFAIQTGDKITTTDGWQGATIAEFEIKHTKAIKTTQLIPFNDGLKVLSITSEGIYLIDQYEENMIHPEPDLEDEEWDAYIDTENGTLSNDNKFIVVGSQSSDHRILDSRGYQIGEIGPQSSYPHFCLFSADDSQLITNSCHFYDGMTIGVSASKLNGLKVEAYEESLLYRVIEDGMRVYCGLAHNDLYMECHPRKSSSI